LALTGGIPQRQSRPQNGGIGFPVWRLISALDNLEDKNHRGFTMKHNSLIAATVGCALVTLSSFAQEAKPAAKEPKTKLEAFEAQTGAVLIKGIGEVGSVSGMGSLEVGVREFTHAGTGRKEYGVTIEVKASGTFERKDTAFIDYDEIDSLLKGIDYISKIDKSVTPLPSFEAVYTTKGELRVITYSTKGKVQAAVQSGRIGAASAFISLDQLAKFRGLIADAKAKLDSIKK